MEDRAANEVSLRVVVGIVTIHQDWEAWPIGQVEDVDGIKIVDSLGNTATRSLVLISLGKKVRCVGIGIDDRCTDDA